MKVSLDAVKELRETTGAPIGDCKAALEAAGGDLTKALGVLREKGFQAAAKMADRPANQGRVESYIHHNGRVGAIVEINCGTDFVARLPEFQQLCKDIAMQVTSQNPLCLKKEDLSARQLEDAKQLGKTPEQLATEVCLLEQPFIKDQGQTIGQYVATLIAKTGENVVVKRFERFEVGGSVS